MSRRVRIRPLSGGTSIGRKNELCGQVYGLGVKFSRIIPTGDTFVVVCLTEEDVDKLIATSAVTTLHNNQFDVIIPPFLKAKKTVIAKRLDRDITTTFSDEELKQDIEERNAWAKVEEVIKFTNMPNMLKVRFTDIKMARKATDNGLCIDKYHLSADQVEMEDFVQLTPCWACYKYDHSIKDCPEKQIKKCSECAATGHTFRECNNKTNLKCLNCGGQHRTLASLCPVRKQKIKEIREERNNNKKQFEMENKTYCAVTKLGKQIPQLKQPESPVLHLNNDMSFKALVIIIHAHLANIARPGTFGSSVKQLLRQNNLPEVILPDDAPSADIFNTVAAFPGEDLKVLVTEEMETQSDEMETEDEIDVDDEEELPEGATAHTYTHTQHGSVSRSSSTATQRQHQTLPPTTTTTQQPPPTTTTTTTTTQLPPQPPSHKRKTPRKQPVQAKNLGLEIFASEKDNIPQVVTPQQLVRGIKEGIIKYTYTEQVIPETALIRYFQEGRLSTERYPVQSVDHTVFRKIRSGLHRSPGDAERGRYRTQKET